MKLLVNLPFVILLALLVTLVGCAGKPPSKTFNIPEQDETEAATALRLAQSCSLLSTADQPATKIISAEVISGPFEIADTTQELPDFCRVVGLIEPAVNFELWLPLTDWNGKYQGVGNGGMAGRISHAQLAAGLLRGYAVASTDTGHVAGPIPFDASWGKGRPDLIADFGHRALHVTTVAAKAITGTYYGKPPAYAYYVGCSKGGQQGLMEVQRYPNDFDGVIAGNPANDWTRFYAGAHLWYSQALLADPSSYIPPTKLPALGAAVDAACDAIDGIVDGILQDPRTCDFDPAVLQCDAGIDDASCLTAAQVTAVKKIWAGKRNSAGELIFPGLMPGGEADPGGWVRWVTGEKPFTALHWLGGEGFFRHFVFEDEDWDFRNFDYDADLEFALNKVGPLVDSADPDISAFRDAGGKLIVFHGWSDADISPLGSINYFNRVVATLAPDQPEAVGRADIQGFYRLFMVPGMGHCRGGPGPDTFDPLLALERWVEQGEAPSRMLAAKMDGEAVLRTRPLCSFPKIAVWDGVGDADDHASFSCQLPKDES